MEMLIKTGMCLLAALFVPVVHEIVKTLVYMGIRRIEPVDESERFRDAFRIHKYIDPVGVIFSIIAYAGISKPYRYRLKSQREYRILGITGFLTLAGLCMGSIVWLRVGFGGMKGLLALENMDICPDMLLSVFLQYVFVISAGMGIVNLFPISTTDMGFLVAGISMPKYFLCILADAKVKLLFFLVVILGIIRIVTLYMLQILLL